MSKRTSKRCTKGHHKWKGKDGIWILVIGLWAIPMLLAFIPHTNPAILQGFKTLNENTPSWYAQGWITMIAFAYGAARLADVAIEHFNTRHLLRRDDPEESTSSEESPPTPSPINPELNKE